MGITLEQAFDALLDDAEFMDLIGNYAEEIGAKGFAAGWASDAHSVENMYAVQNEWTAELIESYYSEFAQRDPWTKALMGEMPLGRFINITDHVPTTAWSDSELYNDLLRPAGDDTWRALGTMIRIPGGFGGLTFYRSRIQSDFSDRDMTVLERDAADLSRLVGLKAALKRASLHADTWRSLVDRFAAEAIIVDPKLRLIDSNAAGEEMIRAREGLSLNRGVLFATSPTTQRELEKAVHKAMTGTVKDVGMVAIGSARRLRRFYVLKAQDPGTAAKILLLGEMPGNLDDGTARVLRLAYRLSPAEAQLMTRLASGQAVGEIAAERNVSVDTVRTQYRSAMGKMDCGKLIDAIVMVRRLIVLSKG